MKPWLKAKEWFKGQQWLNRKQTWAIVGVVIPALAVVGFAIAWKAEQRNRARLEQQLSQTIQAKQLVEAKLSAEEQRSQKLSEALALKTKEVDQVVKRLEAEAKAVELLQGRLAQMESQVNQLQAELVLASRSREELMQRVQAQAGGRSIELEKIVVKPIQLSEALANGKIVQVNVDWQFVVVDLGWHAVDIGDVLGVYRGDEIIAKVKVERVQETLAAASILPEYRTAEIDVDDRVEIL